MVVAWMTDVVSVWANQQRAGSPVLLDRLEALIHLAQTCTATQTHSQPLMHVLVSGYAQISTGRHRFPANWPVTRQRWSV